MRNPRFYKYRTCWAWGHTEWHLLQLEGDETPREHFKNADSPDSDKFRGYEWVKIKSPSGAFLKKRIGDLLQSIRHLKDEVVELRKIEATMSKKTCSDCSHGPRKDCHPGRKAECKQYFKWEPII